MSKILDSIADVERITSTMAVRNHVDVVANATAARAEHAEIVEALKLYGEHRAHCALGMLPQDECTCGLDALLTRITKDGKP